MEQTFVVLDLSGSTQERADRAVAGASAAEKYPQKKWAAIGAIVRADGIDALPAFGRNQPTAASYASTLRRAAKLGRLADCFGQRGDATLIMGFSAVKAMLQKAATPATPATDAPATPATDAPATAAPATAAPATAAPANETEEMIHVEDVDQPEPVRAGRIIAARRERALHEAAGERADARALEERTALAVERDVALKLERAKRALQQIASGRGKAADIARAALADLGE